jgi:hypothetical protein
MVLSFRSSDNRSDDCAPAAGPATKIKISARAGISSSLEPAPDAFEFPMPVFSLDVQSAGVLAASINARAQAQPFDDATPGVRKEGLTLDYKQACTIAGDHQPE